MVDPKFKPMDLVIIKDPEAKGRVDEVRWNAIGVFYYVSWWRGGEMRASGFMEDELVLDGDGK